MRTRAKRISRIVRIVWVAAGVLFVVALFLSHRANRTARLALIGDERVAVEEAGAVVSFRPKREPRATGLIFYPGAMVEPAAYAPLARRIAENGYPVFILKLPLRSAPRPSHVEGLYRRTADTMRGHPEVKRWVVSGHSRGGALAARYGKEHGREVSGLILIATSHPKAPDRDLSGASYPILKIFGTNDGLASEAEVNANRKYLPANSILRRIEGGNHAQFGEYGRQLGDQKAGISRDEQQSLTLEAMLGFLKDVHSADSVVR